MEPNGLTTWGKIFEVTGKHWIFAPNSWDAYFALHPGFQDYLNRVAGLVNKPPIH